MEKRTYPVYLKRKAYNRVITYKKNLKNEKFMGIYLVPWVLMNLGKDPLTSPHFSNY